MFGIIVLDLFGKIWSWVIVKLWVVYVNVGCKDWWGNFLLFNLILYEVESFVVFFGIFWIWIGFIFFISREGLFLLKLEVNFNIEVGGIK